MQATIPGWLYTWAGNKYGINVQSELATQNTVIRPSASPLDKVTIRRASNIPTRDEQVFTVESIDGGETLLAIRVAMINLSRAIVSDSDSEEVLFSLHNFP